MNKIARIITYYQNILASNNKNTKNKEYLVVYRQFIKLKYPKGCHSWEVPHGEDSYKKFNKLISTLITSGKEDKVVEILCNNSETFKDLIDYYKINESNEIKKITYKRMMSYYDEAVYAMKDFIYYEKERQRKLIEQEFNDLEYNNQKILDSRGPK